MMIQEEQQWDKLLKIKSTGRDDSHSDQNRYPYEPTPYCVLERLANSGYIGKKNTLLDYGTGKGRVCFYLSFQIRCRAIGVEYDERIYAGAVKNHLTAVSGKRTSFVMENPFSAEILKTVLAKIVDSYYENPRQLLLFFYYPSDEYIGYLMTHEALVFVDEIDCRDLFPGNDLRERILIFEVG